MAKNPCLDCIDKYEKSKQRKRNAKKRQKKKEETMRPTPVYNIPRGADRFIPPTGSLGTSPQNLTDLLAVLRVNEALKQQVNKPTLDTLERTPTDVKPSKPKTANEAISQVAENYVDIAKSIPQIVKQTLAGTIGAPFVFLGSQSEPNLPRELERTLERTSKPKPKTPNEAVSDALDLFGDTTRTGPGVVRDIVQQLPRDIRTTTTAPFRFVGDVLGPITSSAASAAAAPFRFVGDVISAAGAAAAAAAEPEQTLERTAPATGGDTPAIQFIGGTGRALESNPEEQGANPLPSVFLATPPPASLLDDLQRAGLDEEKRRIADLLASGARQFVPKGAGPLPPVGGSERGPVPARLEGVPLVLIGEPPQLIPQGASPLTPEGGSEPQVLIPESEVADALGGEQTVLDLTLKPRVDAPLVPEPLALYPEGEGLAPLEEQLTPEEEANFVDAEGEEEPVVVVEGEPEPALSPELPLGSEPQVLIETAASLVQGGGAEDLPLTPSSLVQGGLPLTPKGGSLLHRALTRQTTEELAKSVEDVDIPDASALQLQKEYEKQKRDEKKLKKEEQQRKKLEAQLAKIADDEERAVREAQITEGKRLKAEEALRKKEEKTKGKRAEKRTSTHLQIPGVTKRDIAGSPRLETFFLRRPAEQQSAEEALIQSEINQYNRLIGAAVALPQVPSLPSSQEEEPQVITFTQPTAERTFKPFEGGGV